jgi:hypothetical protein
MLNEEDKRDSSPKATRSPTILKIEWGKIEVDGFGTFRDAKLYPGGGREWDWCETNTHHIPGIQQADVQELIDRHCEVVVLTRGMQLLLQTSPATLELLRDMSITTLVEETNAAVASYNRLVSEGKAVGGLFHSTC